MNWYEMYKIKTKISSIKVSDYNDMQSFYQNFMSEVKKILGSKTSLAAMAVAATMILSVIDGWEIDANSKDRIKNDVVQVKENYESNLNTNNQQVNESIQSPENTLEQPQETDTTQPQENSSESFNERFDYVKDQIKLHEGVEHSAYLDSKGIPSIGVGLNLTEPIAKALISRLDINGLGVGAVTADDLISDASSKNKKYTLTNEQIDELLNYNLEIAERDARKFLPNFESYPEQVRQVVTDMSFNLGRGRLFGFKKLRKALMEGNYQQAIAEMIDSPWYTQVGNRSKNLVGLLKSLLPTS